MGEIAVFVSSGRNALIHLHDMDLLPWDVFFGQRPHHDPRTAASANGHHKTIPLSYSFPSFSRNRSCRSSCSVIITRKYFGHHLRLLCQAAWLAVVGCSLST